MLKVLSLFSGIGAFEAALNEENIDWKLDHYCEIDKYACKSYNAIHGTTDEKNLKDVVRIDLDKIGDVDLVTYGFPCVIGNTLVNTKFGITEISRLDPGDMVLSHDGQYHRVSRVIYQGHKRVCVVKGLCFDRIEATENHLFYVIRKKNGSFAYPEWVPCKDLKKGDLLGIPIDNIIDYNVSLEETEKIIKIKEREIAYKTAQAIMKKTKKAVSMEKKNDVYELSVIDDNASHYKDGYLWYPLEYTAATDRYEDVFDITVEDTHSFVANNCIIHNCQDISVAGKGSGFFDEEGNKTRSGLFFDAVKIIDNKKPKFAIFENVKNLTGKKFKKEFEIILDTLDKIGYNTYWQVLNAKDYGVPQNRQRVFGVSIRKDIDHGFNFPKPVVLEHKLKDILEKNVEEKYYLSDKILNKFQNVINKEVSRDVSKTIRTGGRGSFDKHSWDIVAEPKIEQIGNLIESSKRKNPSTGRIYSKYGLCPALNTMQGGHKQRYIVEENINFRSLMYDYGKTYIKTQEFLKLPYYKKWKEVDNNLKIIQRPHGFNNGGIKEICPAITTASFEQNNFVLEKKKDTKATKEIIRKNNEEVVEAMFAYNKIPLNNQTSKTHETNCKNPKGTDEMLIKDTIIDDKVKTNPKLEFVGGIGDNLWLEDGKHFSRNYKQGNRVYSSEGISATLSARGGGLGGSGGALYMVDDLLLKYRIRKLTPKECWRLMGFKDEYFNRAKKVNSDTQLYKQAGNSIVVDVLRHIYKEMKCQYPEYWKEKDLK